MILNLIKKDQGTILVDGLDSVNSYTEILKTVGYLPGELNYYDKMTGIELLKYSERFYHKDCSQKRMQLAMTLELDLSKRISSYSLGNKKKLGIIDAMQHNPSLIILDEPSSGLDPLMQRKLFELLKDAQKNGATILFSSHVLSEVQTICDQAAIIKAGKIIKVEDIKATKNNKVKQVVLTTKMQIKNFIPEITNVYQTEDEYQFLFKGEVNILLDFLADYKLKDLKISEPSLEEVFIHYYD